MVEFGEVDRSAIRCRTDADQRKTKWKRGADCRTTLPVIAGPYDPLRQRQVLPHVQFTQVQVSEQRCSVLV